MSYSFNKQQGFNDFQCQIWLISATACQLHSSRVAVQLKSDFWTGCNVFAEKNRKKITKSEETNFSSALLWFLYAVA